MSELSGAELDALIAQATVDAYSEDEELAGFAVTLEDNLAVPFETTVLGVTVTVRKIAVWLSSLRPPISCVSHPSQQTTFCSFRAGDSPRWPVNRSSVPGGGLP